MSRDLHADAEDCKVKGNDCLAKQDFDGAIKWYAQALDLAKRLPADNNNRHVYYSNRSAAYLSKGFSDSALKDAEACIKEKPDWPKVSFWVLFCSTMLTLALGIWPQGSCPPPR